MKKKKKSLEQFIEEQEYLYYLEVSGRLDAEEFEMAGYEL